ncbi:hypothetical protein SS1G_04643 [Sclerotinia sclerotiorum 1980 UF-70]|uniref:Uncharacterized protein n=1 Tax=Sclerotinia sclerotiorum (strain ATCC 18683 / 1980 / Ss-1) TaxID=665079 RepID=A7EH51_SCLS1|nr:hypothetical protein SS1G_04643 [Sclerotinia sclerotiorum 1980 UF-70]EDO02167.1 hypothetical protein SS1G_04643 [Sclerotinia sclerotiorum 1980 UF-70]
MAGREWYSVGPFAETDSLPVFNGRGAETWRLPACVVSVLRFLFLKLPALDIHVGAGLRKVGTCDFDPLETVPLRFLSDVCLFTSLFGGCCVGLSRGDDSIGAADPWENVREGDSGAILDLGLLFPDIGRDNFRIQEPRDEAESLTTSSPETSLCPSPDRRSDHLRAAPFCDVVGESSLAFEGRRRNAVKVWEVGVDEEPVASEVLRLSGVAMVELVGGLETVDGVPKLEESSTFNVDGTYTGNGLHLSLLLTPLPRRRRSNGGKVVIVKNLMSIVRIPYQAEFLVLGGEGG